MSLETTIEQIKKVFFAELKLARSSLDLENLKVKYLGKKGSLANLMGELKVCPSEERPRFGQLINNLKTEIASSLEAALFDFSSQEMIKKLEQDRLDITFPGKQVS
ncbi:MAG: phenylalanine--tRNA ligase subunit alpha, partial [Parachlamydiales bacterium]